MNEFDTKEEAVAYIEKRQKAWGDNLVLWIEEKNGKFYVYFNLFD